MDQVGLGFGGTMRYARLLLEPEDYADIIGISIKNWALGSRIGGVGGNEAQHRSWTRMRRTGKATKCATEKLIKHIEIQHQLSFLNPFASSSDVTELGTWAVVEPGLSERAKETLTEIRRATLASNHLQQVAESNGPIEFAEELRRARSSHYSDIFHDCAADLARTNNVDYKVMMAPVHVFVASALVFNLLIETHPNKDEGLSAVRSLVHGDDTLSGPGLAMARWLMTVKRELGYETKTKLYAALSPRLDPDDARIQWSKIGNGRVIPPLDSTRAKLKNAIKEANIDTGGSALVERLNLGLWYCTFVARSYHYLRCQNAAKKDEVFLRALAEVEESWGKSSHPR